jgi:hypothetical protein
MSGDSKNTFWLLCATAATGWSLTATGKSSAFLLIAAWTSLGSVALFGRVREVLLVVYSQPKRDACIEVLAYFEGSTSSGEANNLPSFFFHEVRKNETDFMLMKSSNKYGEDDAVSSRNDL